MSKCTVFHASKAMDSIIILLSDSDFHFLSFTLTLSLHMT